MADNNGNAESNDERRVRLLLENWLVHRSQHNYNPTFLIEGLLTVILPKLNYDRSIEEIIKYVHASQAVFRIFEIIRDRHKLFIHDLLELYSTTKYGPTIDLNTKDTDKLRVMSNYLLIAHSSWLCSIYPQYSEKIHDELILFIKKTILYAVQRLRKLVDISEKSMNPNIKTTKVIKDTEIMGMSVAKQQIYIFDYLIHITEHPEILNLIKKYKIHDIFFKFLSTIQCDDHDDDNNRLNTGLYCLSSFLKDLNFTMTFIHAEGTEKLANLPTKNSIAMVMSICFQSLETTVGTFDFIRKKGGDAVPKLLSYGLWLLSNGDTPKICKFFRKSFGFHAILGKFDETLGLNFFNTNIRKLLQEMKQNKDEKFQEEAYNKMIDYLLTLKCYADNHLYNKLRKHYKTKPTLAESIVSFQSAEVNEMLEAVQSLGIYNIFTQISKANSYKYHHDLIYLLFDIIHHYEKMPVNTTMDKVDLNNAYYLQLCGTCKTMSSMCLDIIKIYSIDLEIIPVLINYKKSTIWEQPITYYRENILKIIDNCLWTPIYIFNTENNANTRTIIEKSKRIFYEVKDKLQRGDKIADSLKRMFQLFEQNDNVDLVVRILVGLFVNCNLSREIIEYSVERFTLDFWHNTISSSISQTLFRKYALDFMESMLNQTNIFSKTTDVNNQEPINMTLKLLIQSNDNSTAVNSDLVPSRYEKALKIESGAINIDVPNNRNLDFFTSCCYVPYQSKLFVGTRAGKLIIIDAQTGDIKTIFIQSPYIDQILINNGGNLYIINSLYYAKYAVLCVVDQQSKVQQVIGSNQHNYLEFNTRQDKIIASSDSTATLYDISTKKQLIEFVPSTSNCYTQNRATFGCNDHLVLNDGVLWDINSHKEIYKFNKINNNSFNGKFNPNGVEVIFNQCVWDLRNCRLIKIAPQLCDMSSILLSPTIYAYNPEHGKYKNIFEVVNHINYLPITTYKYPDPLVHIDSLAVNSFSSEIAVVENEFKIENTSQYRTVTKSAVQFYRVK